VLDIENHTKMRRKIIMTKTNVPGSWTKSVGLACFCGLAVLATAAPGGNWPQWRGPLQNGIAPLADPPTTWSETENIRWKVKIPGIGSATPLVWDNLVFVQTAIPTGKKVEAAPPAASEEADAKSAEKGPGKGPGGRRGGAKPSEVYQFSLLCLDRATGKVLWQQTACEQVPHEGTHPDGTFSSSSGLTDGKHVWAYFGSRGIYCYDFQGKLVWSKDLGDMRIAAGFGEGSSPALYKDTLIVNWDNEDGSFIIALDKNTGKELWKQTREERTSWSTPLVIEKDGKAEVVVSATGKIRSYDPASGKVNWECAGMTRNVIPTPVTDNEWVYCASGFQGSSLLAIKLGKTGDLAGTEAIAWSHKKSTPYVPSPLLYNGRLFFFSGNNAMLTCLDAKTGQVLIDAERVEGMQGVYASPVGAAGRVYLTGRNGTIVVIKDSGKLEVLATNKLEDKTDASPVAVGKDLLLRGRENLYCITAK
jgi:outer membrane protein assembly factor BamB